MDNISVLEILSKLQGDTDFIDEVNKSEAVKSILQKLEAIIGKRDIEEKDIRTISAVISNFVRLAGAETSKFHTELNAFTKELRDILRTGGNLNTSDVAVASAQRMGEWTVKSQQQVDSGKKPILSLDPNKQRTQSFTKTFGKPLTKDDLDNSLDKATEKLISFFTGKSADDDNKKKKEKRTFIDDLVDGLAKNKFFGGALMDTVKLLTLLGGAWLKSKFGPLGKYLAVGLVAAGPALGKILVDLMSAGIKGAFRFGSKLLSGALQSVIIKYMPALANALTSPTNALLKSVGVIAPALTAFAAAGFMGKAAIDTWKQGGKTNKVAGGFMGAGALAAAGTGLAVLIAGITAPITGILAAVAGIAFGIGAIIKYHKKIGEFFKTLLDKLNVPRILSEMGQAVADAFYRFTHHGRSREDDTKTTTSIVRGTDMTTATGDSRDSYSTSLNELTGVNKIKTHGILKARIGAGTLKKASQTKAEIDPTTGAITNFALMTKEQGQREMEAYRKRDPKSWSALYEVVPKELVSMGSFQTDLVAPGGQGVYAAKGTTGRLKALRKAVAEAGGNPNQVLLTGAIGSMGSYNEKTGAYKISPHETTGSLRSHTSPFGASYDVSFGGLAPKKMEQVASNLFKGALRVKEEGDHVDIKLGETGEVIKAVQAKKASVKVDQQKNDDKNQSDKNNNNKNDEDKKYTASDVIQMTKNAIKGKGSMLEQIGGFKGGGILSKNDPTGSVNFLRIQSLSQQSLEAIQKRK